MASTTRYRHRMRCGVVSCRHRFTLKRHPDNYKRTIKCPKCGDSTKVHSVEEERKRELAKQDTCYCPMYPFPHRSGSLRLCDNHPAVVSGESCSEEEYQDYLAIMEVPRGGRRRTA